MPQSISQVFLHSVWSTKYRTPWLHPETEPSLHAYIGGILRGLKAYPIQINGMPDHIHILSTFPRTITIAKFIEEIKSSSSKWIKTQDAGLPQFAWQRGYATFSVSQGLVPVVSKYIQNQKLHHTKPTFQEELIEMLKEYGIDYDEQYLWD